MVKERELPYLPSLPVVVAMYLLAIVQTGRSYSTVKCNSAAIAAFHEFASCAPVTAQPLVGSIRDYAKRVLPAGENRKEPISWAKVEAAVDILGKHPCLRNLSGFLRVL